MSWSAFLALRDSLALGKGRPRGAHRRFSFVVIAKVLKNVEHCHDCCQAVLFRFLENSCLPLLLVVLLRRASFTSPFGWRRVDAHGSRSGWMNRGGHDDVDGLVFIRRVRVAV